jgi:hypothetical protein
MDNRRSNNVAQKNDPFTALRDPAPIQTLTPGGSSPPACHIPSEMPAVKSNIKRDQAIPKDSLFFIRRDNTIHIISENYSYKTETYYSILSYELEGRPVLPSSRVILDAYVVPICLERAKRGGIPVCDWGISQGYVPLPVILYGLNYFATTSDFFVVDDNTRAKEVIRHITNIGKYPFCYQKLDEEAMIHSCIGIFGKTIHDCSCVSHMAKKVYELFSIPLVTMVLVKNNDKYRLSSLAPVKYSQLSGEERTLLSAYLTNQGFL